MTNDASYENGSFKPLSPEEEAEWVRRFKLGDHDALGCFLNLYWDGLLQFAVRILEDRSTAEDIVQDAFVRLWERRGSWERRDTLRPVLYRIVRNRALNEKRARDTFKRWAGRFLQRDEGFAPDPLEQTEVRELRGIVRNAVDKLPARRREIFLLVRFHHFSYQEAATALELSPQTIANQMTLAMKDLREALGPHFCNRPPRDLRFPKAQPN